jgi:hypothetical protein
VAKEAMRLMNIGRSIDEEAVAVCENDSCAVDALQVLLGVTAGKGNLIIQNYGKNAYTVLNRSKRQAYRFSHKTHYNVIFDTGSTPDCGDIGSMFTRDGKVETEINGQRIRVDGVFSMGQTLAAYGHAVVGMETYQRLTGLSAAGKTSRPTFSEKRCRFSSHLGL